MATIDLSTLNASQREVASRLDEPLFVAAGAGSGKTFTLTARLVHALSPGSAPDGGRYLDSIDQALVITFTRAAALEIAERVRGALRAAGEEDPLLREESLKVDGAWISTIHGMCARILRRHAIELGIDPAFSICEGSVADALMARALEEVLGEVGQDDAYAALRAEWPLWGSGASVATLIGQLRGEASKCVDGFDALAWPDAHETAHEMARLTAAVEAVCALKLTAKQRETAEAALASLANFAALAPGERTPEAACTALAQVKVPALRKADQKPLSDDARQLLAEATVCAHFERVQPLVPQLVALARRVDERYRVLKLERSYLDNDDLIGLALAAVEGCPEVTADYAGRFRLVMIDEFQDTDERQLRLISLLAGKDACHLATVGDAQQSIYRFRGGDVEVFRARGRELPESQHVRMDVNYRSDPHVLALVERVCGDAELLGDFLKLAADGERVQKRLARGGSDGYKAQASDGSRPPRVYLEVAEGGTSELMSAVLAAQLADRLAAYHAQGQPQGSMALLLGTTTKVQLYLDALRARGLEAVVTGGSSFSAAAEVGVVQALLHTLANPHDTESGLFRLLSSDMFRLDADDFCQLGTRTQEKLDAPTKRPVEQCFVDGELELYGSVQPSWRLRAAHEVISRAFARLGRWQLADVCQAVVDESGWLQRLEAEGTDGLSRAANVLAAVRYVRELTGDLGLGVAQAADEFDQWLTAARLTPKGLAGDTVDAVRVMTVHGSKGLQFGVCAVAECWGKPKVSGRISVGRVAGRCMVCATPKTDLRDFSKMRGQIEVPEDASCCHTAAEWSRYLDDAELRAQMGEKARLLYVALTRAEEALVVGLPVAEKEHLQSELALGMLGAFPELDELELGETPVSIAPKAPVEEELHVTDASGVTRAARRPALVEDGVARVVRLVRGEEKGDPWRVESAGTLAGFDGVLPEAVTQVPLVGTDALGQDVAAPSFELFELPAAQPVLGGWRPRAGVFSYSSAHALMEQQVHPVSGELAEDRSAGKNTGPTRPPAPTRAEQDAQAEGAPYTPDTDKATNLGSAFHELAQTMVETRRDHSPARLEALACTWRLSDRQHRRLTEAMTRWEGSSLRREAMSYDLVRAEVPFFVRVGSRYGNYVEGAIDLLATNTGSREALVVDYKTGDVGLSLQQIEDRHRMQANFYAWVLMSQGFEQVECAFCCVEVDDGADGPQVVRYRFGLDHMPRID